MSQSRTLRYGSVCSGIEAVTCAWHDLDVDGYKLEPAWFAEIAPFPSAVLAHHYPNVPNLQDISREDFCDDAKRLGPIDVLVGGTPCQDVSISGKRAGFAGKRSGLAFAFVHIAQTLKPKVVLWENVPGVFTTNGGRDFGAFLGALADGGFNRISYRICDAQYWGVPQRRRRVFLVGYSGDESVPDAVLFEPQGEGRNPQKGRSTRKKAPRTAGGGAAGHDDGRRGIGGRVMPCLRAGNGNETGGVPFTVQPFEPVCVTGTITHTLTAEGADASCDGTGRGTPIVVQQAMTVNSAQSCAKEVHAFEADTARCLDTQGGFASGQGGTVVVEAMAFTERGREDGRQVETQHEVAYCLRHGGEGTASTNRQVAMAVTESVAFADKIRAGELQTEAQEELSYCLRATGAHRRVALKEEVQLPCGLYENQRGELYQISILNGVTVGGKPGQGYPAVVEAVDELGRPATFRLVAFGEYAEDGMASTVKARDSKDATDLVVNEVGSQAEPTVRYIVRRLTPRECERLQGFPDDWTLIRFPSRAKKKFLQEVVAYLNSTTGRVWTEAEVRQLAADSHRYSAIGNSMAVPVMAWLGRRILRVFQMLDQGQPIPREMFS